MGLAEMSSGLLTAGRIHATIWVSEDGGPAMVASGPTPGGSAMTREVLESALEYLTVDTRGMSMVQIIDAKRTWLDAYKGNALEVSVAVEEAYGRGRSWADACHYLRTRIQQASGI